MPAVMNCGHTVRCYVTVVKYDVDLLRNLCPQMSSEKCYTEIIAAT